MLSSCVGITKTEQRTFFLHCMKDIIHPVPYANVSHHVAKAVLKQCFNHGRATIPYSSISRSPRGAACNKLQGNNPSATKLAPTTQTQHQVEGGLLLDVVVSQCTAILQLLAGKDQALLVRRNALLVLNLALHILDGVRRLHLQSDGLASQGPARKEQPVRGKQQTSTTDHIHAQQKDHHMKRAEAHLTKICMPPRRRSTRWRVDSFWML